MFDRDNRVSEHASHQVASVAATTCASPAFGFRWIPIRSLAARHRPRILSHLLALDERDRYLRFGYAASDAQIGRYVEQLDFERDEVFGIFNRRLELVAMAHLAYLRRQCVQPTAAPSSASRWPGLRAAAATASGCSTMRRCMRATAASTACWCMRSSENTAMLRIVRNAGARIERDGPESQAWVKLAPESLASHVEALVEDRAADLDYRLKRQAHRVDELLSGRPKE